MVGSDHSAEMGKPSTPEAGSPGYLPQGSPANPPRTSWAQRVRNAANAVYQKTIVEKILRRRRVTASGDGRRIPLSIKHDEPLIDPRHGHSYISNSIRTSRYTVWDFIPKQLIFQFSRVGNFYFLCVGIPQMVRRSRYRNLPSYTFHTDIFF